MSLCRFACILGVSFVWGQPAVAQLEDQYGAPLPLGAFARLGAPQFRVIEPVFGARFVDGGKSLLVRVRQNQPPLVARDHEEMISSPF